MQSKSFYFIWILSSISILFLTACNPESSSPNDTQPNDLIRPAKLIKIGKANSNDFLSYPAVIKSQNLSTLSFEVGGVLKKLLVVEAQKVKRGQVLAKLDQRDLKAKLKPVRVEFRNADAEYQRAVRLMKGDAISRSELEARKSKRDMSKAKLETAEKALQDSVLIAPYAGYIAKISIQEQQAVQAGMPAINILGTGKLEATINLPSSIIAIANKPKKRKETSYLVLDVAPNRKIPAQFKEVSLEADVTSQTYAVTFEFKAPKKLNILPGMNATIWFEDPRKLATKKDTVTIPLTAIVTDGNQKYVWVVDTESMAVSKRKITIEDMVGANLNVSSGLELGTTIVASGVSLLTEGMKVRPWSH